MSRLVRRVAVAAGALLPLAGLIAPAAATPPPWTVSATSAPPPTVVNFKMHAVGPAPRLTLVDAAAGLTITCVGAASAGGATTGTYPSGANLLHLFGPAFRVTSCTDSASVTYGATGFGTWRFNGFSGNGAVASGRLAQLTFRMNSASCAFDTGGYSDARFYNGAQQLRVFPAGTLAVTAVSGCAGIVNPGDGLKLSVSFALYPTPNSPITIT